MNTNGGANKPNFGHYCYDFANIRLANLSTDYLAILGAYTYQGSTIIHEAAHFCGIYDDATVFPGIFSKYIQTCQKAPSRGDNSSTQPNFSCLPILSFFFSFPSKIVFNLSNNNSFQTLLSSAESSCTVNKIQNLRQNYSSEFDFVKL